MSEFLYWGLKGAAGGTHPDDLLYHYTTVDGLRGIVESQSLWASSIHHLNDSQEYLHAVEVLEHEVERWGKGQCTSQAERDLLRELAASARAMGSVHVHVFSLSEKHDHLSQWRSYGQGGGYALKFDRNLLAEATKGQGLSLTKCVYDFSEQSRLMRTLLARALERFRGGTAVGGPDAAQDPETWMTEFDEWFLPLAAQIKHPSFHEEAEWRLISGPVPSDAPTGGEHLKGPLIVPHVSVGLSQAWPAVGVVVGPMPHRRLAAEGVWRLFHRRGMKVGDVELSRIPFRLL